MFFLQNISWRVCFFFGSTRFLFPLPWHFSATIEYEAQNGSRENLGFLTNTCECEVLLEDLQESHVFRSLTTGNEAIALFLV